MLQLIWGKFIEQFHFGFELIAVGGKVDNMQLMQRDQQILLILS